jgi:hypothetical protein
MKNKMAQFKEWISCWDYCLIGETLLLIVILSFGALFVYKMICFDQKQNRGGYLVAQYATDGSLARCWVQDNKYQITYTGTTASTWIDDKQHLEVSSKTIALGITDPSKCILIK